MKTASCARHNALGYSNSTSERSTACIARSNTKATFIRTRKQAHSGLSPPFILRIRVLKNLNYGTAKRCSKHSMLERCLCAKIATGDAESTDTMRDWANKWTSTAPMNSIFTPCATQTTRKSGIKEATSRSNLAKSSSSNFSPFSRSGNGEG